MIAVNDITARRRGSQLQKKVHEKTLDDLLNQYYPLAEMTTLEEKRKQHEHQLAQVFGRVNQSFCKSPWMNDYQNLDTIDEAIKHVYLQADTKDKYKLPIRDTILGTKKIRAQIKKVIEMLVPLFKSNNSQFQEAVHEGEVIWLKILNAWRMTLNHQRFQTLTGVLQSVVNEEVVCVVHFNSIFSEEELKSLSIKNLICKVESSSMNRDILENIATRRHNILAAEIELMDKGTSLIQQIMSTLIKMDQASRNIQGWQNHISSSSIIMEKMATQLSVEMRTPDQISQYNMIKRVFKSSRFMQKQCLNPNNQLRKKQIALIEKEIGVFEETLEDLIMVSNSTVIEKMKLCDAAVAVNDEYLNKILNMKNLYSMPSVMMNVGYPEHFFKELEPDAYIVKKDQVWMVVCQKLAQKWTQQPIIRTNSDILDKINESDEEDGQGNEEAVPIKQRIRNGDDSNIGQASKKVDVNKEILQILEPRRESVKELN